VNLKARIMKRIRAQFGRPSGFWGHIVGWIMATRSSNRRRNAWAISLLEIQRRDHVLEIGFGPGVAVSMVSRMAVEGYVCGLDHSDVMLRQATRRNAAAVHKGRVDLRLGSVDLLPEFAEPFDKALAVNAIMFSDRTADRLKALRRVMRPGGRIAIAHQPRGPGATRANTAAKGDAIAAALTHAGFSEVRVHTMKLSPTVVCAIGVKPCDDRPEGSTADANVD
jgi:ubiquinone/menaquinone biosynthesis C-methylase UbiE